MRLTIASGKGGAGKTSVAVSLALVAEEATIVDCDVEEPNVALLLHPEIENTKEATILFPEVDETRCDYCRACADACQFNALMVIPQKVLVFQHLCHGCGTCSWVCPKKAIKEKERVIGIIEKGSKDKISYVGGKLNVGEPLAPPLIRDVKKEIKSNSPLVILDAPAGVSCPFIETLKGSDLCIVVAESTPFGFHDYLLVEEILNQLEFPFCVVENKSGLGDDRLKNHCEKRSLWFCLSLMKESSQWLIQRASH